MLTLKITTLCYLMFWIRAPAAAFTPAMQRRSLPVSYRLTLSLRSSRSSSRSPTSTSADDSTASPDLLLPTSAGVVSAYQLLSQQKSVVRTPLLESPLLNEQLQTRLLVKAECLQTTGSFKYRGAMHRLLRLDPEAAKAGVVAFSSGNFGQALAAAATQLGIKCCIVSPHDAPRLKLDRIQAYGAQLVTSQAQPDENREVVAAALAQQLAEDKGMTLLHPFEDVDVILGQGTCGMELLEQVRELLGAETSPSKIVVPCGGGGLTAGTCLAVQAQEKQQSTDVYTVEPQGYDDHAQSLIRGERTTLADLYPPSSSAVRSKECDALMAGAPGVTTWEINGPQLAGGLASAGDESVARAMKVAFEQFRLVLEPSGALALAAVLDGQVDLSDDDGKPVVVIASGGNTDLNTFTRMMDWVQA